ncbi:hypothetical protein [Megasphaera sp.]|uniref:hypothetical protein n=1 Tax=Megasphaera sp. TaxID=2023260 RepID=UPI001DA23729|nr:hypothetical protein [Megasphaera sp.]MBS6790946.1 hypothetical protein [Megasphaera sp.]
MTRHYTEEEIRRARLVADINNFPELMGAEEDIDCVMVIRVRVWRELDKDYPKLKLYGPSHGEFYEWLINSDQAKTTQFWINLKEKSIKEIYRKYLAEQHKYTRPSEDDLKKFDALMETLKVKELSALTNNERPNSMDRAEKNRKDAQGIFFEGAAKEAFDSGIVNLEGLKDLYEFEFLEMSYTRNWSEEWCIDAAIESLRRRQEHKKNGTWEGK